MLSSALEKPRIVSIVGQWLLELTILAFQSSPRMALNACKTHKLAVMAFVVAIAGIILPAISVNHIISTAFIMEKTCIRLISNFDRISMPKMNDLRLALAATKSKMSSSSLSKLSTGGGESGCVWI